MLDATPSLSRFSSLLRDNGLLPLYTPFPYHPSARPNRRLPAIHGGGGTSWDQNEERDSRLLRESGQIKFTTMFAPTNAALNRLEKQRPWLFQNSTAAAAGGGGGGGEAGGGEGLGEGRGTGEAAGGDAGEWSPVRELLAYHLVPGAALFSRCVRTAGG